MVEKQEEVSGLRQPTRTGQSVTIPDGYLTREDVRICQAAATGDETLVYDQWERFKSLAARIAALLPPEEDAP